MRGLFVVSTCSTPIKFIRYKPDSLVKNQLPQIDPAYSVTIKGGANLMDKHLYVPGGVSTKITERDLEFLTADPKFMENIANGYMSVIGDDGDTERAAKSMKAKDGTAPKTEADFRQRDDKSGLKAGAAHAA